MAIVAVAACIFPPGVVYAQYLEAVARRLGGAVEAGELSLEQAHLMLETLRRSTFLANACSFAAGDIIGRQMLFADASYSPTQQCVGAEVVIQSSVSRDDCKNLIRVMKRSCGSRPLVSRTNCVL
jgi:hypothetical protein